MASVFVSRRVEFSAQTSVLAALYAEPQAWRHGYSIAKETGLKSGSLYPILIRLADRGLVEAHWEEEQLAGLLRRHLTADGLASATAVLAAAARSAKRSGARVRSGRWVTAPSVP